MNIKQYLKTKWNIEKDFDFWMIMLAFSLAGSNIMFVRKYIFKLIGIDPTTPLWIKVICYIPLAFIVYQIGLLIWGTILGQFQFFKRFQGRMLMAILGRSKHVKH